MKTKNVLFLVVCLIIGLNIKAQDDYLRVTELSQIQNGSSIIFAARHDSLSAMDYYAMKNDAAGKPQGISFSATASDDVVVLPSEIIDNESDYCWTVGLSNGSYTFINPNGDMLGYGSSGTDFVKNGANSTWSIAAGVSGDGTSVPEHNAFVITNAGVTNRSIAFRKYSNDAVYEKFAPYANSATNLGGGIYYFYIDIFVKQAEAVPVVSLPVFTPAGGDYTETQNVTITCDTDGATIYYTLDGKNPTDTSMVYSVPIEVSETMTIKAFAKKEGMQNSGIVTAKYDIKESVTVLFYDNGDVLETRSFAKGQMIGELPQPDAPDGFYFTGWSYSEIDNYVTDMPDVVDKTTTIDESVNLYAVFSVSNDTYKSVDVASLRQSDDAVVAISKDGRYYAMNQIVGSSGQPTASEITVLNGRIMGNVSDDLKWHISYSNGEMRIYSGDNDERWLYCTSGTNNNSLRIGDNPDNGSFEMKTIEIDDVVYSDYLYNVATSRYVGVYYDEGAALDWRAYKLTASGAFPSNIKDQTYHFFKGEGNSLYCTKVEIPQSQTITEDVVWGNVSIMNKIIIEKNATLTIDGAIANIHADNIVVKEGGQLIHDNSGVQATVEKEVQGYGSTNEAWYSISTPLNGDVDFSNVEGLLSNDYDLYRYDEPTSIWQNKKDASNDFINMESGRGYLYANKYDVTLSFVGELNGCDVSYELSMTAGQALSGFHLIGNPFSHNIYKGKNAAIDNDNLVDGYYVLSNSGSWDAKLSDEEPIRPCQSILVKTTAETMLDIKKTTAKPMLKNDEEMLLSVAVSNDYYKDVAYVSFNEGAGLEKIEHFNDDIPMVYIHVDNNNYAVAMLDDDMKEIPVAVNAKTMGEYTIAISMEDDAFEYVYLVDNMTGEVTDMLVEDYTFVATASDMPERFLLKLYDINSVGEYVHNENFAYVRNGQLIIDGSYGNAVANIYDMMGRKMISENCEGKTLINIESLNPGVYVVMLSDSDGVKTQKIFID